MQVPKFKEIRFKEKESKYCLLIPLFNEGNRFKSQLKKMIDNGIMNIVDVVICDAGSTDGCTDHDMLKNANITTLLTRIGDGRQGTDLRRGFFWAKNLGYDGIITVDGNDKDDTIAVSDFVKKLEDGYDYIQGSRYIEGGKGINTPFIRHWALKLINEPIMSFCAKKRLTDTTNGFKAYSSKFLFDERVDVFREIFYGYELSYYLPVRACQLSYKIIEIPVTRAYPKNEKTPTKIGGIRGNIYQLKILINIIRNKYNPVK